MALNIHESWDITSKVLLKFTSKRYSEGGWIILRQLNALKIIQLYSTFYCLTLKRLKYHENLQSYKIGIQKRPTWAINFVQLFDRTIYQIWKFFKPA
jgi:hypothetical protein